MCELCQSEYRMPFPESGLDLFLDAMEYIRLHPAELYMPNYIVSLDIVPDPEEYKNDITGFTGLPVPHCGTVGCLAGHIYMTARPPEWKPDETSNQEAEEGAFEALGLTVLDEPGMQQARNYLRNIFGMTWIKTYAELKEEVEKRFTFPEGRELLEPATKEELKRVRDRESARRRRAAKRAAAKKAVHS